MNSKEFNTEVIKEMIESARNKICKLEYVNDYEIAPKAEMIIYSCIEQLENLISQ